MPCGIYRSIASIPLHPASYLNLPKALSSHASHAQMMIGHGLWGVNNLENGKDDGVVERLEGRRTRRNAGY